MTGRFLRRFVSIVPQPATASLRQSGMVTRESNQNLRRLTILSPKVQIHRMAILIVTMQGPATNDILDQ